MYRKANNDVATNGLCVTLVNAYLIAFRSSLLSPMQIRKLAWFLQRIDDESNTCGTGHNDHICHVRTCFALLTWQIQRKKWNEKNLNRVQLWNEMVPTEKKLIDKTKVQYIQMVPKSEEIRKKIIQKKS